MSLILDELSHFAPLLVLTGWLLLAIVFIREPLLV